MNLLARIAIELQSGISHQDRLTSDQYPAPLFGCDASALLRYEQRLFRPLAIDGLAPDVLGAASALMHHPRLEAIARAGDVVRSGRESFA